MLLCFGQFSMSSIWAHWWLCCPCKKKKNYKWRYFCVCGRSPWVCKNSSLTVWLSYFTLILFWSFYLRIAISVFFRRGLGISVASPKPTQPMHLLYIRPCAPESALHHLASPGSLNTIQLWGPGFKGPQIIWLQLNCRAAYITTYWKLNL